MSGDVVRIVALSALHGIAPLARVSEAEGHTFVRRLLDEYASGAHRFTKPGEALYGAYHSTQLVGVGGLTRDPYRDEPRIGRLRHLYVLPTFRRQGVGRLLVATVISTAAHSFDLLTLRTHSPQAAAFYQALGFVATPDEPHATHVRALRDAT